jgi:hypothetical protein
MLEGIRRQGRRRLPDVLFVVFSLCVAMSMREIVKLRNGVGDETSHLERDDPQFWAKSHSSVHGNYATSTMNPQLLNQLPAISMPNERTDNDVVLPKEPKGSTATPVGSLGDVDDNKEMEETDVIFQREPKGSNYTPSVAPGGFGASSNSTTGDSKHGEAAMLEEVIRMLFPSDEMANNYISRFPTFNFSFYVYNLPESYQWKSISDCVEKRYRPKGVSAQEFQADYCDFAGATVCSPRNVTSDTQYSTRRSNRNMDTVVSKLFSDYTGSWLTKDPHLASMLIVPLAANGIFECLGGRKAAQQKTSLKFLQEELFRPFLTYYNNNTKFKHWFLQTTQGMMHHLAHESLLATVNTPGGRTLRTLIVPYVNSNHEYQPPALQRLNDDNAAFEEFFASKNISMAAVMSSKIKGNPTMREMFFNNSESLFGNTMDGLPLNLIHVQGRRRMPDEQETMQLYRQSLFCPSLRGDSPNQKRFFDALLSGCIPVVMAYTRNNETSYFAPNVPVSNYLPYARGSFHGEPSMGIDYSELVVEIDEKCGLACIKPTLEALMKNKKELRQKQRAVVKYARILSYGLAENAWKHVDAMTAMLVQARHEIYTRLL